MPKTLSPDDITTLLTNLPPGSTIELTKTPGGLIVTDSIDQPKTKQQILEERYAGLMGQGITMSEAAKKYDVPGGTIRRWVYQNNYISFVDQDSYPQTIDEAEIALCADIYKERQQAGITRVPYFDEEGCIIEDLKHPKLSEYRRKKRQQKS